MIPQKQKFRFLERIDKIGTAEVSLSIDTKTKDIIVIKLIPKERLTDQAKKDLKKNLMLIYKKKSPNIIRVIDFKEINKIDYIFIEYCNGGDLKNYIKDKYPINESHIQKIINQLLDPIEFMYSKNIIKRVLKLENILINFNRHSNKSENGELPPKYKYSENLLDEDYTIKLADLGYSNPEDDEAEKKIYNDKLDLLSLGVIAYELLTGCSPFNINEQFLPKNLNCSIEIISFINGLLQREPEKRLNWEQIKKHPFLKEASDNFYNINLEKVSGNENDNLFWYKPKYLNLNIGEIGLKEAENKEFKEKCKEDEINKKQHEIEEKAAKAKKDMEKAELERKRKKEEQEKLNNEEKEMEMKKTVLIEQKKYISNVSKELENINLELEKIKSDKENVDEELKNKEEIISEKKAIIENAEKSINNINIIKKAEEELKKLKEDQDEKDNYIKELEEELKRLKEEKKKKEETKKGDEEDKKNDEIMKNLSQKLFEYIEKKKETEKNIDFNKTIIITTNEKVDNYINSGNDNDDIGFIDYCSEKYEIDEDYIKDLFSSKRKIY